MILGQMRRQHDQAPANPGNGQRFECWCGDAAEFVVLDDGQPGEWVPLPNDPQ